MSSLGSDGDWVFFGMAVALVGMAEYCCVVFESLVCVADRWKTPVASEGLAGSSSGSGVSG